MKLRRFGDGEELASVEANAALDAFVLIDHVSGFFLARNRVNGAFFRAGPTTDAHPVENDVGDQFLTSTRRAPLLIQVRLILVAEIL